MQIFKINSADGATLTVCAENYDLAARIFIDWHVKTSGKHPREFEVLMRNRCWRGNNRAHINAVLAKGVSGIATYDPAQGWTITPVAMSGG